MIRPIPSGQAAVNPDRAVAQKSKKTHQGNRDCDHYSLWDTYAHSENLANKEFTKWQLRGGADGGDTNWNRKLLVSFSNANNK
jgi:hypothetical protein